MSAFYSGMNSDVSKKCFTLYKINICFLRTFCYNVHVNTSNSMKGKLPVSILFDSITAKTQLPAFFTKMREMSFFCRECVFRIQKGKGKGEMNFLALFFQFAVYLFYNSFVLITNHIKSHNYLPTDICLHNRSHMVNPVILYCRNRAASPVILLPLSVPVSTQADAFSANSKIVGTRGIHPDSTDAGIPGFGLLPVGIKKAKA